MNWYKKASIDLSSITPDQWKEINDRMVGLGYDFRGVEDTKRIYEKLNNLNAIDEDHKKVLDSVISGKDYITSYSPQKIRGTFQRAIKYFGLTNNLRECGYILPNGSMLDFSGKNMGWPGGTRGVDHRDINEIIEMPEFVSMGAIRHFPEQPGVDIRKNPTEQQLNIIYRDVENSSNGYTVEIIDSKRGRFYNLYNIGVKASKVINDIRKFYNKLAFNLAFYKFAQSDFIYHNTKKEFLEDIIKNGLESGSFTNRPIDFGGDIWLAISKSILPERTQEHDYGRDKKGTIIAIEPPYDNFIIAPEYLYLADRRGKVLGRLNQSSSPKPLSPVNPSL